MEMEEREGFYRELARLFAGTASEVRVRIVTELGNSREGMVVGDLLPLIGIPASTLSHHLDRLRGDGWVTVERRGTFLRYRLRHEAVETLSQFLAHLRASKGNRRTTPAPKKQGGSSRGRGGEGEVQIEFD